MPAAIKPLRGENRTAACCSQWTAHLTMNWEKAIRAGKRGQYGTVHCFQKEV